MCCSDESREEEEEDAAAAKVAKKIGEEKEEGKQRQVAEMGELSIPPHPYRTSQPTNHHQL